MSKGLEALERLVDGNLNEVNYYRQFCDSTTYIMKDKQTIEKELKVLEIIKEYPYELTTALAQPSYEMYCLWFKNFKSVRPKLSEAQYNLIRSVMCEDK